MGLERRRSLRFPFDASAEMSPDNSTARISARVTEISLNGCYLQTGETFDVGASLFVKIFAQDNFFESHATVLYAQPKSGMGVAFRQPKPHFAAVLKKWLLAAMLATQKPPG